MLKLGFEYVIIEPQLLHVVIYSCYLFCFTKATDILLVKGISSRYMASLYFSCTGFTHEMNFLLFYCTSQDLGV